MTDKLTPKQGAVPTSFHRVQRANNGMPGMPRCGGALHHTWKAARGLTACVPAPALFTPEHGNKESLPHLMPAEAAWGAEYSADFAFRCAVTSSSQELAMTDARFLRI